MRTLTTLAILAMSAGTAAADHQTFYSNQAQDSYDDNASLVSQQVSPRELPWNQQPQTEARYQQRNKLADVSLDGFRNRVYVQLPSQRGLDYLELRAGQTPFELSDVIVRFADGREIHTGSRGVVEPFQGRVIDLPPNSAPVIAVIPQYATPSRYGARLEVFGVPEHRFMRSGTRVSAYGTASRRW